tara:strand:+ start:2142 stop:2747 length:606 start_codon:yes stop_codon:yes gene_type:complete
LHIKVQYEQVFLKSSAIYYIINYVFIVNLILSKLLSEIIAEHIDFPKKGIVYKDVLPLLQHPELFSEVIQKMSEWELFKKADALISIDARGFIFGTAISMKLSKPMVLARKPGKLPGEILSKSYSLEYGSNSLSIQKQAIKNFKKFIIIDDLLATGGTVKCVADLLKDSKKEVLGLSVVIELKKLGGKYMFDFPVNSQVLF